MAKIASCWRSSKSRGIQLNRWVVFGSLLIFLISCNSRVFRVYGLGLNIDDELLSFDCASQWGIRFFLCPKLGIISDLKVFKAAFGWGRSCKDLPKIYLVHMFVKLGKRKCYPQKGCTNPLTSNPKPFNFFDLMKNYTWANKTTYSLSHVTTIEPNCY